MIRFERTERGGYFSGIIVFLALLPSSYNVIVAWESVLALGPGRGRFGAKEAQELHTYRPESIGEVWL